LSLYLVESNDSLYGNDEKFIEEIHKRLTKICEQIIQFFKELSKTVMMKNRIENI